VNDHLYTDVVYAIQKLTDGQAVGGVVHFSGGHVADVQFECDPEQRAHFTLVLERVNISQLSVILGILRRPPVIDLTSITMEPDGMPVRHR
jgi:hypothetical protein